MRQATRHTVILVSCHAVPKGSILEDQSTRKKDSRLSGHQQEAHQVIRISLCDLATMHRS